MMTSQFHSTLQNIVGAPDHIDIKHKGEPNLSLHVYAIFLNLFFLLHYPYMIEQDQRDWKKQLASHSHL
jgi:hypothetical protein